MIAWETLLQNSHSASLPVYVRLADALMENIRNGKLRPGVRVPSSREMAGYLNVHRKTVVAAYRELVQQGWLEMRNRQGSFVPGVLPETQPVRPETSLTGRNPATANFDIYPLSPGLRTPAIPHGNGLLIDDGFPDTRITPMDVLLREYKSLTRRSVYRKLFQYGNPAGVERLIDTLTRDLNATRGLNIGPGEVMITKGTQMAMYLAARLLVKTGDQVAVGEPGYFAANLTFQLCGAQLNRIPVDEKGIQVDRLEQLCKKQPIRLVYVVPHHHYPTTVTLSAERRVQLLRLARKYRFAILEDDYDYDYHYNGPPLMPMASLDGEGSVIYIGTFSKTIAPSVRVGFLIAPQNFITEATKMRRYIDRQGDNLMEAVIAELYDNGTIARHIKKAVRLYRLRRDHFCDLLSNRLGGHVTFRIPAGGMSVWTKFEADLGKLSAKVRKHGLIIGDGTLYDTGGEYNSLRLGFASLDFKEQEQAIGILQRCLAEKP